MDKLLSKISIATGIKFNTLFEASQKMGVSNLLLHPNSPSNLTKEEKAKLKGLIDFMAVWNEVQFLNDDTILDSSSKCGKYCIDSLKMCQTERFIILYLDSQNKLIKSETLFHGTVQECPIYPRELIKKVLDNDATSVIIAHNHPGGSLRPSTADIASTKNIKTALETINVHLINHIIVAGSCNDEYCSFAEKGLL